MTNSVLKTIALITMIIDHCGYVFCDNNIIMRGIGRIAFPLFILTFTQGFIHTSNRKNYITKLIIMAFISEPFFDQCLSGSFSSFSSQNVLFTFLLAIAAIYFSDKFKTSAVYKYDKICIYLAVIILGDSMSVDYGAIGVIAILTSYELYKSKLIETYPLIKCIPCLILLLCNHLWQNNTAFLIGYIIAGVLIFFSCEEYGFLSKNRTLKDIIFISYPAHLMILSIFALIV